MNLKIKICGMRQPANIMEVANLKPDLMGFIFYPGSPRYAGETLKTENLIFLSEEIVRVGVFVNMDIEKINKTILKYSLDMVQLHGDEDPEMCRQINENGVGVIKAFNIKESSDFVLCEKYINHTRYFLFDASTSKYGGSGKKLDWELLEKYNLKHPFFLSGGIAPGDEKEIKKIKNPAFYGIDVNSRFEISPGIKDFEKLKIFIADIRSRPVVTQLPNLDYSITTT